MIFEKYLIKESPQNPDDNDIMVGALVDFDSGNGSFTGKVTKMKGEFTWVDVISRDRKQWKKDVGVSWKGVKILTQEDIIMVLD